MAAKSKSKEPTMEQKVSQLKLLRTNRSYQHLISKEQLLQLRYDELGNDAELEDFVRLEDTMGTALDYEYSDYCYAIYKHCAFDKEYSFFNLRLIQCSAVDGVYSFYVCPAIKQVRDMAKKVTLPPVINRLGLVAGELSISLDDLPKPKLDNTNSVYDAKLKRRVPILPTEEKKQGATAKVDKNDKSSALDFKMGNEKPKDKETKKAKVLPIQDDMINNTDEFVEGMTRPHSSEFLPPHVCTRLWVLGYEPNTNWVWYCKFVENTKSRREYYCRPDTVEDYDWQKQYDRGGGMITIAYEKSQFPNLDVDFLEHNLLVKIVAEFKSKAWNQEINCLIDAQLLKWD